MQSPEDMYAIHQMPRFNEPPVLIHAFTGYVDAGGAVRMTIEHLLEHCEHELIASFDVDAVMDYRARRPVLSYSPEPFGSRSTP